MSAAAQEARAGFREAAPAQLPADLDAETPTKKGAGKKRKVEAAQPARRSLRENRKLTPKAAAALAGEGDFDEEEGEAAFYDEVEEAKALRSAKTATRQRKAEETPAEAAAELDAHNRNRIASMSEGQLRTRIKRMTNVAKLKSVIAELEGCGMAGLAAEARSKLAGLKAGTAAEPADGEYEPRASDEEEEEEEEEEWAPRRRR
ncbi:zinc finger and BTB domain-containing 24 [Chlorella sorokiniana]|uniref:Zinc finger and BTB domain-containing 24 n=1 Tax=Chlorella sorokiniana TaxID=3076 RepID=A0A2P6U4G6_CHLSO|nr:zinc finger and BTB domain-containing 24 [Chlorella sorokiniana]|eukprot:PRW61201.1 zinc finger and BTB domain-containing 24 [Chlorella sorokiniana]